MRNSSCDWVGARLALWVGDRHCIDSGALDTDGGDLRCEDRRLIEEHLRVCFSCRSHQHALERALSALWVAADQLPVNSASSSLWPMLKQRIGDNHTSEFVPEPHAASASSARPKPALATLDSDRPLHRAWIRDNMREVFAIALGHRSRAQNGLVLLGSLTIAAALLLVVALPMLQRQRSAAERRIGINTAPLGKSISVQKADDQTADAVIESTDSADSPTNQLAEAEITRTADTTGSPSDSARTTKNASKARFGYDLEHGIPALPDAHGSKPVY